MSKKYDYIVIGAGISGATAARLLTDKGKKVLVVERRNHIGGNCYDYTCQETGINIHKYGAHIFHTNDEKVWKFVNRFTEFNNYVHTVQAIGNDGKIYSIPFSMHTFSKLWPEITTLAAAQQKIKENCYSDEMTGNLEDHCLNMIGAELYELLVKHYTYKQWSKDPKELLPEIIKRIPLRFNWDNRYFTDKYQGIPVKGYARMIENMLRGIDIVKDDFCEKFGDYYNMGNYFIFTGMLHDLERAVGGAFSDVKKLEYRSLEFKHEINYHFTQGAAVINNCQEVSKVAYTRTIEHKYFDKDNKFTQGTVITEEYPAAYRSGGEAYYPVNNNVNDKIANESRKWLQRRIGNVHGTTDIYFLGRNANYKYLDMDKAVAEAIELCEEL